MPEYCSLNDVKAYIRTAKPTDDALLSNFIPRASGAIDDYCGRTFTARLETRLYDAIEDVKAGVLLLDEDLTEVIEVLNGDGTALTSSQYVLLPPNSEPKYALRLRGGAAWNWTGDPAEAIRITGSWGYSTVPPAAIVHAATRLTAWYYHQLSAPFEAVGLPEMGQIIVPKELPTDVKALLAPYIRAGIA